MSAKSTPLIWRVMRFFNRQSVINRIRTSKMSDMVLLLTTMGRKSGLPRTTPLQYEKIDNVYYVGAERGKEADWVRNILTNPEVNLQIGEQHIAATARPITAPAEIANFLEYRLQRHPLMIAAMLRTHGLTGPINRTKIEAVAPRLMVVALYPKTDLPQG